MAVPVYNNLYAPILQLLKDGKVYTFTELADFCAELLGLSDEDRALCMPTGRNYYYNRMSWAATYLKKAGLIESAGKGMYVITDEGLKVLRENREIDNAFLRQYPSFVAFHRTRKKKEDKKSAVIIPAPAPEPPKMSPLEQIEDAVTALNKSLADDLIGKVIKLPLRQFEKFIIKLLAAMGYDSMPGSRASVTKKVGDGGIDGVLRADKFGFDSIYIQAKQWKKDSAVGSPEIQKFAGSMSLNGAQKGLFITTAHFTADAVKTSKANPACKMVLIDGDALAKLMIEYDIGVSTTEIFKVKSIDSDFFNDFD